MQRQIMDSNPFHRAIFLTGPTASGKTAVGVELARLIDAEIIALDSKTLFRGMDIGTAKPTLQERRGIPHHLIDVLEPWETTSVAVYRCWAWDLAQAIEGRGKRVLFVGGTALYLKALLRGLFTGPAADPALRARLESEAEALGSPSLHARLQELDPQSARRLHPNDRLRLIRALEVLELTGRPLSEHQLEHDRPAPKNCQVFALTRGREELYGRINRRVWAMLEAGWVEEVRALRASPRPPSPVALQTVGYAEMMELLEGRLSLDATVERIQTRSRRLAKRQMTWFRNLVEIQPVAVDPEATPEELAKRLATLIE
jgi:tRNA dimethylallyltransferase